MHLELIDRRKHRSIKMSRVGEPAHPDNRLKRP